MPDQKNKREQRCRQLKAQGSCKTGDLCPAHITFTEDSSGSVQVTCVLDHVGHENEGKHLRIDKESRARIAKELTDGVKASVICKKARKEVTPTKTIRRTNLMTTKDVRNIANSFNLVKSGKGHTEDPSHVDLRSEEQKLLPDA
jgi:hypothetical protein